MARITSPGHKLGQLIGNFFEEFFSDRLVKLAEELGFYCDKRGPRPGVRHGRREVIWTDNESNKHKLDYVFERNGSESKQGKPVAFIKLAWRRYTKHSRNKAGEIEAALIPLRDTYRNTCSFVGTILGGEYTEGAIDQLQSKKIGVLYIPYKKIAAAFLTKGMALDYPEKASQKLKFSLIRAWADLKPVDIEDIKKAFEDLIGPDYSRFVQLVKEALLKKIERIRIIPLFGNEMIFASTSDAITAIEEFGMICSGKEEFHKFEVSMRFTNGSKIECSFREREETLEFLRIYETDLS